MAERIAKCRVIFGGTCKSTGAELICKFAFYLVLRKIGHVLCLFAAQNNIFKRVPVAKENPKVILLSCLTPMMVRNGQMFYGCDFSEIWLTMCHTVCNMQCEQGH